MQSPAEAAAALRAHLAAVGRAKRESEHEDIAEHLALPIAARLARTIALSDSIISMTPQHIDDEGDDEAEVWGRVQARLERRSR
jgi:hypothetical protein